MYLVFLAAALPKIILYVLVIIQEFWLRWDKAELTCDLWKRGLAKRTMAEPGLSTIRYCDSIRGRPHNGRLANQKGAPKILALASWNRI